MDLEEKVISIIADSLGFPVEVITREFSFVDDLEADALHIYWLVMDFEDEFNIEISEDDYDKMRTVGDAIDYIKERRVQNA